MVERKEPVEFGSRTRSPSIRIEGISFDYLNQQRPSDDKAIALDVGNASIELVDVGIDKAHTGIKTGPQGSVKSRGLRISKYIAGVDNQGEFDGPDTIFERPNRPGEELAGE
jgi:hypothetical protein